MANSDFISEIMFEEHGTSVLITDCASDRFIDDNKKRQLKARMPQWFTENDSTDQNPNNLR